MILHFKFLCQVLIALIFIKIGLKLFLPKKYKIFEHWGLRPQTPVLPTDGDFAPDPQASSPPLQNSGYAPASNITNVISKTT